MNRITQESYDTFKEKVEDRVMFKLNNEETRETFKTLLQDLLGNDVSILCDESNNTSEIINQKRMRANIVSSLGEDYIEVSILDIKCSGNLFDYIQDQIYLQYCLEKLNNLANKLKED